MKNRKSKQNADAIEATISRCARGHDTYVVILNGFRLFGPKCCGQWEIIRRFRTTLPDLRDDLASAGVGLADAALAADATTAPAMISA